MEVYVRRVRGKAVAARRVSTANSWVNYTTRTVHASDRSGRSEVKSMPDASAGRYNAVVLDVHRNRKSGHGHEQLSPTRYRQVSWRLIIFTCTSRYNMKHVQRNSVRLADTMRGETCPLTRSRRDQSRAEHFFAATSGRIRHWAVP